MTASVILGACLPQIGSLPAAEAAGLHGTTESLPFQCAGLRTTWKQNGAYVVPEKSRVLCYKRKSPIIYWNSGVLFGYGGWI